MTKQQQGEERRWVVAEPYAGDLKERRLVQVTNQPLADQAGFALNTNGHVAYAVDRDAAMGLRNRLNALEDRIERLEQKAALADEAQHYCEFARPFSNEDNPFWDNWQLRYDAIEAGR